MSFHGSWSRGRALSVLSALSVSSVPFVLSVSTVPAHAQDTVPPVEQGVRIGITYTPGTRAGMLVLGGTETVRLDSVRAILRRDLDYSDRFELISLPGGDSLMLGILGSSAASAAGGAPFVNYSLYAALGRRYRAAWSEDHRHRSGRSPVPRRRRCGT